MLIPKLRPIIAPSLHSPMEPSLAPNKEWRKRILDSRSGQSNADPLQIVNPLPVTLHWYIKMSPGHVQLLLIFTSLPDPLPTSTWIILQLDQFLCYSCTCTMLCYSMDTQYNTSNLWLM